MVFEPYLPGFFWRIIRNYLCSTVYSALLPAGLIRPVLYSFLDSDIILTNLISVIGGQYAVA